MILPRFQIYISNALVLVFIRRLTFHLLFKGNFWVSGFEERKLVSGRRSRTMLKVSAFIDFSTARYNDFEFIDLLCKTIPIQPLPSRYPDRGVSEHDLDCPWETYDIPNYARQTDHSQFNHNQWSSLTTYQNLSTLTHSPRTTTVQTERTSFRIFLCPVQPPVNNQQSCEFYYFVIHIAAQSIEFLYKTINQAVLAKMIKFHEIILPSLVFLHGNSKIGNQHGLWKALLFLQPKLIVWCRLRSW